MIDYRILGPLEVSANGRVIEIGGPKLRALLVILLLRPNESVPRDVLVHELWGEQPPVGAQHLRMSRGCASRSTRRPPDLSW